MNFYAVFIELPSRKVGMLYLIVIINIYLTFCLFEHTDSSESPILCCLTYSFKMFLSRLKNKIIVSYFGKFTF